MPEPSNDEDFDALMASFGFSKTLTDDFTPEEKFFRHLTFGLNPRITNFEMLLYREMSTYNSLGKRNITLHTTLYRDGVVKQHQLTPNDYARFIVETYLLGNYGMHFQPQLATVQWPTCNIDTMVDLIMGLDTIKKAATRK